jgi:hypothetical protein
MFFVVERQSGANWDPSRPLEEQEGWRAHADFMNELVDQGFVVLGGTLEDQRRAVLAIEADSEDTVRETLARDPMGRDAPGDRERRSLDDPPRRA